MHVVKPPPLAIHKEVTVVAGVSEGVAATAVTPTHMPSPQHTFACDYECDFKGNFEQVSAHEPICRLNGASGKGVDIAAGVHMHSDVKYQQQRDEEGKEAMEALLLHPHASGAARVAPAPAPAPATAEATATAAATHVQLTVRCGRHWSKMQVIDRCDEMEVLGCCNAYCHVQWQGQTHITDVKINSFSPEWGQTFKFALDSQAQGEGSDLSVTVLNMDLDEPRATDGTCDGGEQQLGRSTLIGQVFIPADALRAFLLQHHTHDVTQGMTSRRVSSISKCVAWVQERRRTRRRFMEAVQSKCRRCMQSLQHEPRSEQKRARRTPAARGALEAQFPMLRLRRRRSSLTSSGLTSRSHTSTTASRHPSCSRESSTTLSGPSGSREMRRRRKRRESASPRHSSCCPPPRFARAVCSSKAAGNRDATGGKRDDRRKQDDDTRTTPPSSDSPPPSSAQSLEGRLAHLRLMPQANHGRMGRVSAL